MCVCVQADAAILVVNARPTEFERGLNGGQTEEHATVLRALGILFIPSDSHGAVLCVLAMCYCHCRCRLSGRRE